MDRARYPVDAVVIDHRSLREVARAHGLSKSWVAILVQRYRTGGYNAITPKSKRPHSSPTRIPVDIENAIITLRKELLDAGLDAGATTILWHLQQQQQQQQQHIAPPSVSNIWRILTRRGFITPEPKNVPTPPTSVSKQPYPTNAVNCPPRTNCVPRESWAIGRSCRRVLSKD